MIISFTKMDYKVERNQKFLSYFWDLASDETNVRVSASVSIVSFLMNNEEDERTSSEVEYAVKRLIKGLTSSRQSARQGFSTCLCELMHVFSNSDFSIISVSTILDILEKETLVSLEIIFEPLVLQNLLHYCLC